MIHNLRFDAAMTLRLFNFNSIMEKVTIHKNRTQEVLTVFTYVLYALAGTGLLISFIKDKKKTKMALKKAWKSFENILPQLLTVMIIIGFALAVLSPETISKLIGSESGVFGIIAAALLENGAGYMQITAFVSTLMMVGVITIPMETKVLGKKLTLVRNCAAFGFSILAAFVMGVIL